VQPGIDDVRQGQRIGVDVSPRVLKADKISPSTLCTRAMSSGEGGGFVEEEQLRPPAWGHDLAVPTTKLQSAGDPAADLGVAHNGALRIVQDAPVAHERPAPG